MIIFIFQNVVLSAILGLENVWFMAELKNKTKKKKAKNTNEI